jgi:acyl-CoA thioesterase-1
MQMKRMIFPSFLVILIITSGCMSTPADRGELSFPPDKSYPLGKIVVIGDSITTGYFPMTNITPYPAYLSDIMQGHIVINAGVTGQQSSQMLSRFQTDVVNNTPQYVIIQGGSNDIRHDVPIKTTEMNLKSMYQLAKQNNIIPITTTLYFDNSFNKSQSRQVVELNAWIVNYSTENNIPVVDFNKPFQDPVNLSQSRPSLLSDGMHPSEAGHHEMANDIYYQIFSTNASPG